MRRLPVIGRSDAGRVPQRAHGESFLGNLVNATALGSLVLEGSAGHPELVRYSDNVRQLDGLAAAGLVADATARWLKETYIGYRTLLHHLSLEGRQRVVEAAEHAQRRARVQEIWRETFG